MDDRKPSQGFDLRRLIEPLKDGSAITAFHKGQALFSQGEASDAVFYIEKGKVTLTVVSEQGKEAVIAMLGNGDFCGEGCLAGQPLRMSTAVASEDSDIIRVDEIQRIFRTIHGLYARPKRPR